MKGFSSPGKELDVKERTHVGKGFPGMIVVCFSMEGEERERGGGRKGKKVGRMRRVSSPYQGCSIPLPFLPFLPHFPSVLGFGRPYTL